MLTKADKWKLGGASAVWVVGCMGLANAHMPTLALVILFGVWLIGGLVALSNYAEYLKGDEYPDDDDGIDDDEDDEEENEEDEEEDEEDEDEVTR